MPNGENENHASGTQNDFAVRLAQASVCYCFLNWLFPIPNPFISSPGFPAITTSFLGWTETENDSGDEFWNALVLMKFYDANTKQVLLVVPQIMVLPRNSYTRTRSRTLAWVGFGASWWPWAWPAWPAWPAPVRGAVNTGPQALAAVGLAECTTAGIPCP